jgi:benzoate membrane transport protein
MRQRSSNSSCRSPSRCSSCRTARALPSCAARDTRRPSTRSAPPAGCGRSFAGLVGTVSTCLTGPTNAILSTGRDTRTHYAAGILVGLLALVIRALLAASSRSCCWRRHRPSSRRWPASPCCACCKGRSPLPSRGPSASARWSPFLVTVSGIAIAGIGAPFWGLVFGALVSRLLERGGFRSFHGPEKK